MDSLYRNLAIALTILSVFIGPAAAQQAITITSVPTIHPLSLSIFSDISGIINDIVHAISGNTNTGPAFNASNFTSYNTTLQEIFPANSFNITGNFSYYGIYNGKFVTLNLVAERNVSSLPDAQLVGTITNFYTSNPGYSCLNNQTLIVWTAPNEYPGYLVVHNSGEGIQCAYITLIINNNTGITTPTLIPRPGPTTTIPIIPYPTTTIPGSTQSGYQYTGTYNGTAYSFSWVPNNTIENLSDSSLVGIITNFQTTNPAFSCLDGSTLNVWTAPNQYPGELVVHNGLQGSQCTYLTLTLSASSVSPSFNPTMTESRSYLYGTNYQITVWLSNIGAPGPYNVSFMLKPPGSSTYNAFYTSNTLASTSSDGYSWAQDQLAVGTYSAKAYVVSSTGASAYTNVVTFNVNDTPITSCNSVNVSSLSNQLGLYYCNTGTVTNYALNVSGGANGAYAYVYTENNSNGEQSLLLGPVSGSAATCSPAQKLFTAPVNTNLLVEVSESARSTCSGSGAAYAELSATGVANSGLPMANVSVQYTSSPYSNFTTNFTVSNGPGIFPYSYDIIFQAPSGSTIFSITEQSGGNASYGWQYAGLRMSPGINYTVKAIVYDGHGNYIGTTNIARVHVQASGGASGQLSAFVDGSRGPVTNMSQHQVASTGGGAYATISARGGTPNGQATILYSAAPNIGGVFMSYSGEGQPAALTFNSTGGFSVPDSFTIHPGTYDWVAVQDKSTGKISNWVLVTWSNTVNVYPSPYNYTYDGTVGLFNNAIGYVMWMPNSNIENLSYATEVGQIANFYTNNPAYSCLNGQSLNIWEVPISGQVKGSTPAFYIVHNGAQGPQCTYITGLLTNVFTSGTTTSTVSTTVTTTTVTTTTIPQSTVSAQLNITTNPATPPYAPNIGIDMQAYAYGGTGTYQYSYYVRNLSTSSFGAPILTSGFEATNQYVYGFTNSTLSPNLVAGRSYYGQVKVTDTAGHVAYTPQVLFTLPLPLTFKPTMTEATGTYPNGTPDYQLDVQLSGSGQSPPYKITYMLAPPGASGYTSLYTVNVTTASTTVVYEVHPSQFSGPGLYHATAYITTGSGAVAYTNSVEFNVTSGTTSFQPCGTLATTVYIGGQNATCGSFTVSLVSLSQPNSQGISSGVFAVYYQGRLTNESSVSPGTTARFNVTGHSLYITVNQTFAGLYAYQKYAQIYLSGTATPQPRVSLSINTYPTSPISINMQAFASGGTPPYVYHFSVSQSAQSPDFIYNSSPTPSETWTYSFFNNTVTPKLLPGGTYYGMVEVTDSLGKVNYSAYTQFTVPTTTPSSYASCNSYAVTTNGTSVSTSGLCSWGGGQLQVYASGGNSGAVSYKIANLAGTFTATNATTSRCSTYIQTINAPAGIYNISIHTGAGGGSCGSETVWLTTAPQAQ